MKVQIVVALSLIAAVKCRPDVSHLPTGSYLPPGSSSGGYFPPSSSYLPVDSGKEETHVFFYGSQEDLQAKFKVNVVPASQKNTKIIFVKAPGYNVVPEVIAPPSQTEDKTLVYVLVKKPQDGAITIPTGLGVKQAKPEVFFIKYNNKQDAAPQVSAGTQGQQVGNAVSEVGSEDAFVGILGNGANGQGFSGYPSHGPTGGSGPY